MLRVLCIFQMSSRPVQFARLVIDFINTKTENFNHKFYSLTKFEYLMFCQNKSRGLNEDKPGYQALIKNTRDIEMSPRVVAWQINLGKDLLCLETLHIAKWLALKWELLNSSCDSISGY